MEQPAMTTLPVVGVPSVEGTTATFEDFFRAANADLFRALCLITGSREEAEDITQVAFIRVLERWERVRAMEHPVGYLYRVAMNEFRSRRRRTLRGFRHAIVGGDPDDAFAGVEDRDELVRALRDLPTQQRASIVLTGLLQYSSEEAANLLGISSSAVRAHASKARDAIRTRSEAPR
jgi:RNA polymerase sigma-70 factor (ECF subfamily)